MPAEEIERLLRRWYAMSILTNRYSSVKVQFDTDIRQIETDGLREYAETVIANSLPDTFWTGMSPQSMHTSWRKSPFLLAYLAAQARLGDKGCVSRAITVRDLLRNRGDKDRIHPHAYVQRNGLTRARYNQITEFVIAQSEMILATGDKPPEPYFRRIADQVNGARSGSGASPTGRLLSRS